MSLINYRMIGFGIASFIFDAYLSNRAARIDGAAFNTLPSNSPLCTWSAWWSAGSASLPPTPTRRTELARPSAQGKPSLGLLGPGTRSLFCWLLGVQL